MVIWMNSQLMVIRMNRQPMDIWMNWQPMDIWQSLGSPNYFHDSFPVGAPRNSARYWTGTHTLALHGLENPKD